MRVPHSAWGRGRTSAARRPAWLVLFAIALIIPLVSCTRRSAASDQAPDVRVEILEIRPDPPAVGQAVLFLQLTDRRGAPLRGATLQLKADMTHAGMTPVFSQARDDGDGRYRATVEWTMAGDWIVTLSGTLEDGRTIQRELQVNVSSGGG